MEYTPDLWALGRLGFRQQSDIGLYATLAGPQFTHRKRAGLEGKNFQL